MKLIPKIICKHKKKYLKKIFEYNKRPSYEKKFSIKGKYFRSFYQCEICKHIYASHSFDIFNLYSKQYLELTYKNIEGIHDRFKSVTNLPKNKSDNKNRAERVNNFFKKRNLKLLDIGSGIGVFLFEMKKRKWNVSGIEMDKRYANYCKKFHKLKVYPKKISELKNYKEFDLISLNKVLEHVKDPGKLLKISKKFLKNNGIAYIEVPDIKAKSGGKHRQEFCVDHLHLFSKYSLNNLANFCGFETLSIQRLNEPSGKFTLLGFFKKKEAI